MKAIITLIFTLFTIVTFGQWDIIHASGDNGGHRDLFFLNNDTGFVIGLYAIDGAEVHSYVLRTQDGGQTWDSLHFANHEFSTIHFPSADTGYIASFYLPNYPSFDVLRTVDGGDSWQHIAVSIGQASGIPYAISFFNNDNGIITLSNWAAKTTNAGINWDILDGFPGTRDNDVSNTNFVGLDGTLLVKSHINFASYDVD